MSFKTVVLDRVRLVDLDTLFIYHLVCALVCICSFIDSDTTARDIMGVEFGIDIFITQSFPYENHGECYKKLSSRLWPMLFTLTNFSLLHTLFSSVAK